MVPEPAPERTTEHTVLEPHWFSGGPIRTAVVGYGLAGSVFHAPALDADPTFQLDAIVTANPERSAAAASRYPRAAIVDSLDQLAWSELDLVVLASPPATHAPFAHQALDAGLAVVVDKPFATSSAQALELAEHAARVHRPLAVYQNRRWDGEIQTARSLIEAGELGEVYRFESRMERWAPSISKAWKTENRAGNGLLFDLGTHLIDQALHLFGPVEQVYGELDARRFNEPSDDDVFVALLHSNGVRSHLSASATVAQKTSRMRVLGSKAAYVKHFGDLQEEQIQNGILPGDSRYGVDPADNWGTLGRGEDLLTVPTLRGDYPAFYRLMSESIRLGAPTPVDPMEAVECLRIVEDVLRINGR
ncbi:Gfo/Idh/MocA family oxidoreductase [Psychromicrobium xiongbiense]|uniref:Gfo/Idh/MocA family protein n=1 Tax=Psychromicrobium xiongbiense TaxID=3051184 RepID=UPI0025529288|nr:Gfo/Idh/MocA family oxidoreductase [Psychromicrobium sp. YIM S02556]